MLAYASIATQPASQPQIRGICGQNFCEECANIETSPDLLQCLN
jgi:hypothetical protein